MLRTTSAAVDSVSSQGAVGVGDADMGGRIGNDQCGQNQLTAGHHLLDVEQEDRQSVERCEERPADSRPVRP